jgi:hypothetical protein
MQPTATFAPLGSVSPASSAGTAPLQTGKSDRLTGELGNLLGCADWVRGIGVQWLTPRLRGRAPSVRLHRFFPGSQIGSSFETLGCFVEVAPLTMSHGLRSAHEQPAGYN